LLIAHTAYLVVGIFGNLLACNSINDDWMMPKRTKNGSKTNLWHLGLESVLGTHLAFAIAHALQARP
jgi:hypothetical protein